ncbi:MAG TPA: hypothetical protein VJ870_20725 [Amycolatopsis sp.]|nr:hypothetical protein [Amycolatopsis sp.]
MRPAAGRPRAEPEDPQVHQARNRRDPRDPQDRRDPQGRRGRGAVSGRREVRPAGLAELADPPGAWAAASQAARPVVEAW